VKGPRRSDFRWAQTENEARPDVLFDVVKKRDGITESSTDLIFPGDRPWSYHIRRLRPSLDGVGPFP
jgi:hypothetical protein